MRAKTRQEETADVPIVVLPIHLPDIPVPVSPHEGVELLPDGIHFKDGNSTTHGWYREKGLAGEGRGRRVLGCLLPERREHGAHQVHPLGQAPDQT